jgi:hypothetical protein
MGLFDRLVKNAVGDALRDVVSDAVNQALGTDQPTQPAAEPVADGAQPAAADQATQTQPTTTASGQLSGTDGFRTMFAEDFPELSVRELVPVSEFGGEGKPYDFGLYRDGKAVAVVMLTPHNRDNNQAFKGAKAAAGSAGVPFINFYLHMSNERGYVSQRIRSFIG